MAALLPRAFVSKYLNATHCFASSVRHYARFAHRPPLRVLTSTEASNLNRPTLTFQQDEQPAPTANVKPFAKKSAAETEEIKKDSAKAKYKKPSLANRQEKLQDLYESRIPSHGSKEVGEKHFKGSNKAKQITIVKLPSYDDTNIQLQVITDKQTAERKLAGFMQNTKSQKARKACGLIFLEGERLISDAIRSGLKAKALFVSKPELLAKLNLPKNFSTELYQVPYEKIQLWSELVTSPGLIGIFSLENIKEIWSRTAKHVPLTLICDNIKDPGNMGSIIRCGAAVGCRNIITTPECVDVWDSKVVRAAAGAHFRVNIELDVNWDIIAGNYVSEDTSVILADCHQKGAQSHMSSEETARLAKILAEEETAQTSNSRSVEVLEGGDSQKRDSSFLNEKLLKLYRKMPLPQTMYSDIKLNEGQSAILVIGGETHGLSAGAHKLAHQYGGCKAFIPLENEVDSLNASVAAGILTYELRRKILSKDLKKNNELNPNLVTLG